MACDSRQAFPLGSRPSQKATLEEVGMTTRMRRPMTATRFPHRHELRRVSVRQLCGRTTWLPWESRFASCGRNASTPEVAMAPTISARASLARVWAGGDERPQGQRGRDYLRRSSGTQPTGTVHQTEWASSTLPRNPTKTGTGRLILGSDRCAHAGP